MRGVGGATAVLLVLAVGACGGAGGTVVATSDRGAPPPEVPLSPDRLERDAATAATAAVAATSGATQASQPTFRFRIPRPAVVVLETAVFWDRFEVHPRRASFTPSGYGDSGILVISGTFVNHSLDRAMLDLADVALEQTGERLPAGLSKIPVLEGGGTMTGFFGFWLPDGFDPTSAVLAFGAADTNQSVVPLGRPTETVTIAPQPIEVRGKGRTSDVRIGISGGHLVPSFQPTERGLGHLRLSFAVGYDGEDPLGLLVDNDDFVLTLPDGADVIGAALASDDLALEIVPAHGELTGQEVTFVVPLPVTGRYSVRYTSPIGEVATITFVVA